jgi:hypothetical protein
MNVTVTLDQTFWGWALLVIIGLVVLVAIGVGVCRMLASARVDVGRQRITAHETHEAARAGNAIDELYRQAEQEVRRLAP